MAVIIEEFKPQTVVLGTDINLDINISGNNITTVTVIGPALGFYYNWTGTQCQIRGKAGSLISNGKFTVASTDDDGTVERIGTINVVPASTNNE